MQEVFCQRIRNKAGLALFAGLVVLANVADAEQPSPEIQGEPGDQQIQQNASFSSPQVRALEIDLKKAQERAQVAEKMADLAEKKLGRLEAAVAEKDDQLEAELQEAEETAQSAKRKAELAKSQRSALETELKKALGGEQLSEKDVNLNDLDPGRKPVPLASGRLSDSFLQSPGPLAPLPVMASPKFAAKAVTDHALGTSTEAQPPKKIVLEYSLTTRNGDLTSSDAPQKPGDKNQRAAQGTPPPGFAPHRQGSRRVIAPRIHHIRQKPFERSKLDDVKTRLIALWHRSLARSRWLSRSKEIGEATP